MIDLAGTIEYWSYRWASWLSRILPEKLAYWLGLRVSDAFYVLNRSGRRAVIRNLETVLVAQHIVPATGALRGLARKTFQYFGKYLVDFFRYARVTKDEMRRRFSIEHGEYLERCVGTGRGLLMVTAHLGNWELGGAVMSALGYKVNALVFPTRLKKLNRMFEKQRAKRGMKLIPVGHSAFKIIRLLKQGEIVALLGDRDFTGKHEFADFFGRQAGMPRGPGWLAMKTQTPVLPTFLLRQVDDTFLMKFYPPILPEEAGSAEEINRRIWRVLEDVIGAQPYQWFIFDDFWNGGSGATAGALEP